MDEHREQEHGLAAHDFLGEQLHNPLVGVERFAECFRLGLHQLVGGINLPFDGATQAIQRSLRVQRPIHAETILGGKVLPFALALGKFVSWDGRLACPVGGSF